MTPARDEPVPLVSASRTGDKSSGFVAYWGVFVEACFCSAIVAAKDGDWVMRKAVKRMWT
jgi:hypothetical protein